MGPENETNKTARWVANSVYADQILHSLAQSKTHLTADPGVASLNPSSAT